MDTNITHLEPEPSVGRSARLADEPDLDVAAHPAGEASVESTASDAVSPRPRKGPRKKRGRLLSGVALGALIVAASGVFLLSPFNTVIPVPPAIIALVAEAKQVITRSLPQSHPQAAEPGAAPQGSAAIPPQKPKITSQSEPVVAPAASLAATRVPPRPDSITASRYAAQPREQSLEELLKLRGGDPDGASDVQQPHHASGPGVIASSKPVVTQPAHTPSNGAPTSDVQEPGASATEASVALKPTHLDITSTVTQAALGQATPALKPSEPAQVPAPIPAPPTKPSVSTITVSPDAPAGLASSQAAAMAEVRPDVAFAKAPVLVLSVPAGHQEQAEVLQYVTGLSSEIARLRTENETLRKDVARRISEQDGRLADFNRRVSVAEARAALRSAADAGRGDEIQADPVARVAAQPVLTPVVQTAGARPSSQSGMTRPRYHVQAASPGLALLAEIGRGGGDGAQLQVAVGDQVPGYGVVKSVAQRGPSWVVQTEHGSID